MTRALVQPHSLAGLLLLLLIPGHGVRAGEADWPQLARDPQRTAGAANGVPPPYRARWIWCGPDKTLRNKAADPNWPDDLSSGAPAGINYPTPERVPFTLAGRAQPVT